jgi:hypothetical protein
LLSVLLIFGIFSLMRMTANSPITRQPGGPVDKPVNEIARRLNATADQVLLAWVKAKGAVVVTYGTPFLSSSSDFLTDRSCLLSFCLSIFQDELKAISVGRLLGGGRPRSAHTPSALPTTVCSSRLSPELTAADITAIDLAGAKGARRETFVKTVRVMAELMLLGAVLFRIYAFLVV